MPQIRGDVKAPFEASYCRIIQDENRIDLENAVINQAPTAKRIGATLTTEISHKNAQKAQEENK
ncbi:MAG: hypothetical protein L6437_09040 [Kiritimatiellae bacterium]|nr:hypothetical protein [Kiritimatiellia bacterium]